jgi:hypothetical protein
MARLNVRQLDLTIDTIRIRADLGKSLRVIFKGTKTLKSDPNTCSIKVYNLSPEHRAALTAKKKPVVSLTAGYKDELTSIFLGEAIHVDHERSGADIVSTISTSDGGDRAQHARVNVSFGPRTKIDTVLRTLVKSLGLKDGNVSAAAAQLAKGLKADIYLGAVTLSGNASFEMTQLIRSAGLEWSIQDGAVQILNQGAASAKFSILLDESVLVGTPSISGKGLVKGVTFLQRDFIPGRQVQIDHEFVKGAFRLEKCEYSGDTYEEDWYVAFEAKGKS